MGGWVVAAVQQRPVLEAGSWVGGVGMAMVNGALGRGRGVERVMFWGQGEC